MSSRAGRADVFFEAGQFGGAGDGNDPGLLREQPGERDLGGGGFLALRDVQQIDEGLVGLAGFRREAGEGAAEVGACRTLVFSSILPVRKPLPSGL